MNQHKSRYTFFLEYGGGTYLSQFVSASFPLAFSDWLDMLGSDGVVENGREIAQGFVQASVDEGDPVPIAGLNGVWCASALVGAGSAMVHIVKS